MKACAVRLELAPVGERRGFGDQRGDLALHRVGTRSRLTALRGQRQACFERVCQRRLVGPVERWERRPLGPQFVEARIHLGSIRLPGGFDQVRSLLSCGVAGGLCCGRGQGCLLHTLEVRTRSLHDRSEPRRRLGVGRTSLVPVARQPRELGTATLRIPRPLEVLDGLHEDGLTPCARRRGSAHFGLAHLGLARNRPRPLADNLVPGPLGHVVERRQISDALDGREPHILVVGVDGDGHEVTRLVYTLEGAQPHIGMVGVARCRRQAARLANAVDGGECHRGERRRPRNLRKQPLVGHRGGRALRARFVACVAGERQQASARVGPHLRVRIALGQPREHVHVVEPRHGRPAHARGLVARRHRDEQRVFGVRQAFDRRRTHGGIGVLPGRLRSQSVEQSHIATSSRPMPRVG